MSIVYTETFFISKSLLCFTYKLLVLSSSNSETGWLDILFYLYFIATIIDNIFQAINATNSSQLLTSVK